MIFVDAMLSWWWFVVMLPVANLQLPSLSQHTKEKCDPWLLDLRLVPDKCRSDEDCSGGLCCSGELRPVLEDGCRLTFADPASIKFHVVNKECLKPKVPVNFVCTRNITSCSCEIGQCILHPESGHSLCWDTENA